MPESQGSGQVGLLSYWKRVQAAFPFLCTSRCLLCLERASKIPCPPPHPHLPILRHLNPSSSQKCSLNTQVTASLLRPKSLPGQNVDFQGASSECPFLLHEGIIRLSVHPSPCTNKETEMQKGRESSPVSHSWSGLEYLPHSMPSLTLPEAQLDRAPQSCWTMFSREAHPLGCGDQFYEH